MKYQIGPQPELLKEIGQVMVNYSECERSIHDIFRVAMSMDEDQMHLLVSKANLNTEKMIPVIKSVLHRIRPSSLHDSIMQGLSDFSKSVPKRNAVAHWQWAVTQGSVGMATNSLKAKPGQPAESRHYTLKELERIAWELARSAILLVNAATAMRSIGQPLADATWGRNPYEFESDSLDHAVAYATDRVQQFIRTFESENFPPSQSPYADTPPR